MSYLALIRREFRLLSFGVLLTCLSGFGQTFFVSIYGEQIRETFDLTNASFGLVYAIASTANAVILIWVGKFVDEIDLRLYAGLALAGLAAGCLLMSFSTTVIALGVAFFLLRLCGQGLMAHISSTAMIRYIEDGRAKALSVASMGHKLSEIVFPAMAVGVLLLVDWRTSWLLYVGVIVVVMIPLMLFLLRGHTARHVRMLEDTGARAKAEAAAHENRKARRQWTRGEVLRDTRFYMVLPAWIAPAFLGTAVFFHQAVLVEHKGWTLEWFALMFTPYALAGLAGAFLGAPLVDRFGPYKVMPWVMLPFTVGLVFLATIDHAVGAFLFMGTAGISAGGLMLAVSGTLWAESYGVQNIGSIRAVIRSVVLLSTAVSPPLVGWLLDAGMHFNTIAWGFAVYCGCACVLLAMAARLFARPGWADLLPAE